MKGKPKTTKELLQKARAFLARHKWGQNDYYNTKTHAYCALGALNAAFYGPKNYRASWTEILAPSLPHQSEEAYARLAEAERWLRAILDDDVAGFNDDPGRTKQDIIALYDEAIELAG